MEWDVESKALNDAILYMEKASERARERFIYHLSHRFFPEGRFDPSVSHETDWSRFTNIDPENIFPGATHFQDLRTKPNPGRKG